MTRSLPPSYQRIRLMLLAAVLVVFGVLAGLVAGSPLGGGVVRVAAELTRAVQQLWLG